MEMKKSQYIQILICFLLSVIGCVIYVWYYKEYIKPRSYTIGTPTVMAYEELPIKEYFSSDNVIFSANLNDISFANKEGEATYEMNFAPKDYNGLLNNYAVFVNNDLVLDYSQTAGAMKANHAITYNDIENKPISKSNIKIDFAFYSQSSTLKISLPSKDLGLLMNYFKSNDFVITLAKNPFTMNDTQTDDEFGRINCNINVTNNGKVYIEYSGLQSGNSAKLLVNKSDSLKIFTVLNDIENIVVDTDGRHTISYSTNANEYTVSWTDANYINITVNYTAKVV